MTDAPRLTDAEIDEFADDANADDLTYFKVKDVARAIRQLRAERDEARSARLVVTDDKRLAAIAALRCKHSEWDEIMDALADYLESLAP